MHLPIRRSVLQQNKYKKLKPGLVAFYDIRPKNGPILKGSEEISKEKVKKKD